MVNILAYQLVDGLVNASHVKRWKSLHLKGWRFRKFDVASAVRIKHNYYTHPEEGESY